MTTTGPVAAFRRDRSTWLAYGMLAYYAALQVAISPLMIFIAPRLRLSHAGAAAHLSAFAIGMVLTGLAGPAATRRFGRGLSFWGGALAMAVGTLGLVLAKHALLTLAACLLMGLLGTLLLVTIQAALSDLHGPHRAVALTEANVGATLAAMLAPVLIGGAERIGLGYRWGVLPILLLGVAAPLLTRTLTVPTVASGSPVCDETRRGSFSPRFRAWWTVVVVGVAIEWCLVFWAPLLLETTTRLSAADASLAMSVFFGSMLVGRLSASRLVRRLDATRLLQASLLLLAVGTVGFWLSPWAPVKLAALATAGLGVANIYPLAMSLAVGAEPERADAASARVVLGVGLSLILAPLLLGWLADRVGISHAFGAVVLVLPVAWWASLIARRGENGHIPARAE